MATKQLAMALTACCFWVFMAIGFSNNAMAQCENGVCKLPAKVAKAVVEPVAKTVVKANKTVKRVVVRPFRRWRR